jgi:hypothetical protein
MKTQQLIAEMLQEMREIKEILSYQNNPARKLSVAEQAVRDAEKLKPRFDGKK